MTPAAWARYWLFGLIFGPICIIYGAAAGDAKVGGLGVLVLFVAVGMRAFWRQKASDVGPSGTNR